MINKPMDLIIADTKDNIYKVLNESGLSISILNMIIKNVAEDVNNQTNNCINRLRKEYYEALSKEEEVNKIEDVEN